MEGGLPGHSLNEGINELSLGRSLARTVIDDATRSCVEETICMGQSPSFPLSLLINGETATVSDISYMIYEC